MDFKKNLSDLMPWYVNQTADEASRRRLENVLQRSPEAQAEVSWLKRLRDHIQGDKRQNQLPADDAGLDRLMTLIAAEKSGKVAAITPPAQVRSWYKPTLAIAATVMLAQAIGLFALVNNHPAGDSIRMLAGGTAAPQGAVLQVTFKPAATEAQMRASLASIEGEIVGGPGILGIYDIRVGKGMGQSAANKLQQQKGVIDTATVTRN